MRENNIYLQKNNINKIAVKSLKRQWFSGKMFPFQGRAGGSIPP